jgi:hypothetical protein
MDKTESTVRNMLTAVEAPLYDIGVLSDRGMLPGLDSIPAAAVLDRLSLLKYRNARGSHIYVRPSGEHRFTVLDDLNETTLARLSVDGFNPCAVIKTSAGNFQAWLKHIAVFPKLIGTLAAQTIFGKENWLYPLMTVVMTSFSLSSVTCRWLTKATCLRSRPRIDRDVCVGPKSNP